MGADMPVMGNSRELGLDERTERRRQAAHLDKAPLGAPHADIFARLVSVLEGNLAEWLRELRLVLEQAEKLGGLPAELVEIEADVLCTGAVRENAVGVDQADLVHPQTVGQRTELRHREIVHLLHGVADGHGHADQVGIGLIVHVGQYVLQGFRDLLVGIPFRHVVLQEPQGNQHDHKSHQHGEGKLKGQSARKRHFFRTSRTTSLQTASNLGCPLRTAIA